MATAVYSQLLMYRLATNKQTVVAIMLLEYFTMNCLTTWISVILAPAWRQVGGFLYCF